MSAELSIWTVTERPRDYPDKFVARRWLVDRQGEHPTSDILLSDDIEWIRAWLRERGFVCIPRQEADDPVIVESWL